MSASIIQKSADPFTDASLAKLYLDPVLNKGSVFLFDFLNPTSNPNADGLVADGTVFKNLVEGGGDGNFQQLGSNYPVNSLAGKQGLQTAGQTAGNSTSPNLFLGDTAPTADKPFMVSVWMKQNGIAFGGVSGFVMGDAVAVSGATGTVQWAWALFVPAANQIQASQRLVGSTALAAGPAAASTAVRHAALSWNAGQLVLYINGAIVASAAGVPSPIGATGRRPFMGFQQPGTYYRAYMERLDLSGRSALAAVQAEYAANNGRFA